MMGLRLARFGVLFGFVVMVGCQQPVKWTIKSQLDPDPVKIGKKFTATCTVTGEVDKIGWVTAMPVIAPEFASEMRDDGKAPDTKQGDGVFTTAAEVPVEAEPGIYEVEFVVYDKNGDPLSVPSFTILDKDGKKVLKEVAPEEQNEDKTATVEFSSIITITLE